MRLRTELEIAAVALVTVQVVTSFAAIGLLVRMGPAVERILDDNVTSVIAVEQMLGAIALAEHDLPGAAARYQQGLTLARENITEAEEEPLLARLDEMGPGALAGDGTARAAAVGALDALSEVNRESMARTDASEQRLGYGGAWAAAVLGVVSFAVGVLVSRRLVDRVVAPLAEVDATLQAARRGDPRRRSAVLDAPEEVARVARDVNDLLDERQALCTKPPPQSALLDRAALLHLLEASPSPLVVVDEDGGLHAANHAARDRLAAEDGPALRSALRGMDAGALSEAATTLGITRVAPLGDGIAALCVLPAAAADLRTG
jgi:PAS domain-containing protein